MNIWDRKLRLKEELERKINYHKMQLAGLEKQMYHDVKYGCTHPKEHIVNHGTYREDGDIWEATECGICGKWFHDVVKDSDYDE